MSERFDLAVVGGGVIGLACAWRAAQRGLRVAVVDAGVAGNASHAAAGMLAPASELGESARRLTPLNRASYALYPDFVAELEELTGADLAFRLCGSLVVALTTTPSPSWRRSTRPSRRKGSRPSSSTPPPARRWSRASPPKSAAPSGCRTKDRSTRAPSSRRWSRPAASRA